MNLAGTAAVPNGESGVRLEEGSSGNTIGGTASGCGNVISGNVLEGVLIPDSGTSGNLVAGNLVGTDSTGSVSVPNLEGVEVKDGATGNTIGGTAAGGAMRSRATKTMAWPCTPRARPTISSRGT